MHSELKISLCSFAVFTASCLAGACAIQASAPLSGHFNAGNSGKDRTSERTRGGIEKNGTDSRFTDTSGRDNPDGRKDGSAINKGGDRGELDWTKKSGFGRRNQDGFRDKDGYSENPFTHRSGEDARDEYRENNGSGDDFAADDGKCGKDDYPGSGSGLNSRDRGDSESGYTDENNDCQKTASGENDEPLDYNGEDNTENGGNDDSAAEAGSNGDDGTATGGPVAGGLDSERKQRADRLISVFENGDTEIQYGYAEALDDGRGITCGRAGFTTETGDAYEVVKRYNEKKPNNPLSGYLASLSRGSSNLAGFTEAWKTAANDPVFRQIQDEVSDELYYEPAMKHAQDLGLAMPLSKVVLYDAAIQHGDGDDPDGLPALISRTSREAGGSPKSGVDEKQWLSTFLSVRRADLSNASNGETRGVWAESVSRVDILSSILKSGNTGFNGPITITNSDYAGTRIP